MSMALLSSSSLHLPQKRFNLFHPNRLQICKNPILMTGFVSKKQFLGGLGSSYQKSMEMLARVEKYGGGGVAEKEAEAEAVLGDAQLGKFEAILNKLSKWLVACLFGLYILWRHDGEALWAAMGSVVNSWLSITLKQILNHQRPVSALRSDPGMPSSHAQSIFYIAVLGILSLFQWMGTNLFTVSMGAFILISGSYLTWLRVSQQLHTTSQVLVGAILGSSCAISWFWLWHAFVLKAFISSIWVRVIVVLGSAAFCIAFTFYVVREWLIDEL
ncbi:lipid phosphate phosphatase epsilon 2, chloroplastic-like [Dioscorea cayenensis subsp. rotundata]|uniref:Lipid phosphate phosphatase epsilon 2, chloroplastic-like n=1 Tax=Dioscorea cayennensis subsp. rotundata TaxID=55577 RepID=A0AB40CWF3_DIOCR|nr:lipid phosphate phosphatase epsilon 2, chloroplastic-like [Dioscorea cayenensis subsp. rotundata]